MFRCQLKPHSQTMWHYWSMHEYSSADSQNHNEFLEWHDRAVVLPQQSWKDSNHQTAETHWTWQHWIQAPGDVIWRSLQLYHQKSSRPSVEDKSQRIDYVGWLYTNFMHSLLATWETWGSLPIITQGEAQGDYRCIPKVSQHLRDLLECNNWLRLYGLYLLGFWWACGGYRLH